MEDEQLGRGWIDYILASDNPADKSLVDEHRARSWAYAETMQWIVGNENVSAEAFDKLQEENELANELQARIRVRGAELMKAGAKPASEEQVTAWNATWIPLVSKLPNDGTSGHWT